MYRTRDRHANQYTSDAVLRPYVDWLIFNKLGTVNQLKPDDVINLWVYMGPMVAWVNMPVVYTSIRYVLAYWPQNRGWSITTVTMALQDLQGHYHQDKRSTQ